MAAGDGGQAATDGQVGATGPGQAAAEAARLADEEDPDEEPVEYGCPSFMCFDFKGQALHKTLQPIPIQGVRGYPQEVLGKLKSYRAAKFSLLQLLRQAPDGGHKVDLSKAFQGQQFGSRA